ncbi:MAG: amidohydrolase family protein [Saprospiraceae bacterium]
MKTNFDLLQSDLKVFGLHKAISFQLFFILTILLLNACQDKKEPSETPLNQAEIAKIDIHTHYRADKPFLVSLLQEWNMKTVLVEVARTDSTGVKEYWPELKAQHAKHPDQFFLCTGFNAFGIDDPAFAQNIIKKLETDISQGAKMVKVWKNFGMVDKDQSGAYVQIDDPRLQPIWDFLIAKDIPVIAHIGEPLQAWRPLQEGNPHYNYYANNPQYHAYLHPEIPSWETIMAARDHWLANNPDLIVVGAHMGSMSFDVDVVAERLEKYPNFYVETAARWGDITGQESEKVRQFFIKYQDRVLYGTDLATSPSEEDQTPEALKEEGDRIRKIIGLDWQYLSGTDSLYYDSPMISFPVSTKSLALPKEVLQKFYWENAAKVLKM